MAAALALVCATLLASCNRADDAPVPVKREFDSRGIVRGISPDRGTIEIQHEAIGDFMPAMTMPFSVKDPALVSDLTVGDAVAFRLQVTLTEASIASIRKIDGSEVNLDATPAAPASD